MYDKTFIVTGANSGLGLETAMALSRDPSALVILACRDPDRGDDALRQVRAAGGEGMLLPLDLTSQASVRAFTARFRASGLPPLAGIVCNAGISNTGAPQSTTEGYETTFAVNHLNHYLLVRLLLDELGLNGRITFVSSSGHDPEQRTGMPAPNYTEARTLAFDFEEGRSAGLRRYTTSKLCNILCTYELSRRLATSSDNRRASIRVNVLDPGLMTNTNLGRSLPKLVQWLIRYSAPLARLFTDNVHSTRTSGARLAALTSEPDGGPGGRYFSNGKPVASSAVSYDERLQRELWDSSAAMVGLSNNL